MPSYTLALTGDQQAELAANLRANPPYGATMVREFRFYAVEVRTPAHPLRPSGFVGPFGEGK